jgi:hypothetical protein
MLEISVGVFLAIFVFPLGCVTVSFKLLLPRYFSYLFLFVARMGEVRGAYNILVGRSEGRRPLGRPRRRWEDNIMMDLREIGFGDVDWFHWAQDRDRWRALVNTVVNLPVP